MSEYILYDLEGQKHIYLHRIDVRTALATGLYTAERPEPKIKKKTAPSSPTKSKFNISDIDTEKMSAKGLQDDAKIKPDIEKMEKNIKEKKS